MEGIYPSHPPRDLRHWSPESSQIFNDSLALVRIRWIKLKSGLKLYRSNHQEIGRVTWKIQIFLPLNIHNSRGESLPKIQGIVPMVDYGQVTGQSFTGRSFQWDVRGGEGGDGVHAHSFPSFVAFFPLNKSLKLNYVTLVTTRILAPSFFMRHKVEMIPMYKFMWLSYIQRTFPFPFCKSHISNLNGRIMFL